MAGRDGRPGARRAVARGPAGVPVCCHRLDSPVTSGPGPALDGARSPTNCRSPPAESRPSRPLRAPWRLLRGARGPRRCEHLRLAPRTCGNRRALRVRPPTPRATADPTPRLAADAASPASGGRGRGLSRRVHGVGPAPGEPDFHVWRPPTGRGRGGSRGPAGRSRAGSHCPGFALRERGAGETVRSVRWPNPVEAPPWTLSERRRSSGPARRLPRPLLSVSRPPGARPPSNFPRELPRTPRGENQEAPPSPLAARAW